MSPRLAVKMIRHWLRVSFFCCSRRSSINASCRAAEMAGRTSSCSPSGGGFSPPAALRPFPGQLLRALRRCRNLRRRARRSAERGVDFIESAAPRLVAEGPKADQAEDIPGGKICESRPKHDEVGRCGLDYIGGAHERRQAERPDELAEVADAVADSHAAGAQAGRPNLGHIRPDHRIVGAAKESLRQEQQV